MLSKKEYKENLIRMFDSLRDEHKGEENCIGVACGDCPLYKKACGSLFAFEAIEFAEKWAKDHPIKTNADKFKEIFGVEAPIDKKLEHQAIDMAIKALEQEPKTGHWIRVDENKLRCSACEVVHLIAQYPNGKIGWCPNCGAKMIEPQESEIVKQGGVSDDVQIAIRKLLKDANEMAIEVDTGTYTMKAIGIGLLEQIAEQLKEGGAEE